MFTGYSEENYENISQIANNLADIRTRNLTNSSLKIYR
jgi:hypothetical protein